MSSKIQPVFQGKIIGGVFVPLDEYKKLRLDRWMKYLEGKSVDMVLRVKKYRRSQKQNNYYWGVVIPVIGEAIGETSDQEVHELLRWKFLKKSKWIETKHGSDVLSLEVEMAQSTASLTKGEFVEYIMEIEKWASTFFGITIPRPDEYDPVQLISDDEEEK